MNTQQHIRAVTASIEKILESETAQEAAIFAMKLQLLANAAACKKDALESKADGDVELAMLDETRVKHAVAAAKGVGQ